MADAQTRTQALIDELTESGAELGLQVAAFLDGEPVVDAWSGRTDPKSDATVDGDTLFTVFSSTKGVTATVIHLLAEHGQLHYDDPIARHWPEFGAAGKEPITIRQALAHTSGVPQMPDGIGPAELGNWDQICRGIAALSPLWKPGTETGYHALTYGWILGEVARRVDGRPIAAIVPEEICRPLGIEDSLFFGIPDSVESRVATLLNGPPPPEPPPPDALMNRAIPAPVANFARVFNRPEVRRASIPGAGGITTARALARHYASLIGTGVEGVRLLSPETIQQATELQTEQVDLVLGEAQPRGLGWVLGNPASAMGRRRTAFGHRGAGGSIGFADPEHRFAFALTKNRLVWTDEPAQSTAERVAREVRSALSIPEGP